MHGTLNLPAQAGQVSPSLQELAKEISREHAEFVATLSAALSNGAERAIKIGNKLQTARDATGHGRWSEFVWSCENLNDRTARQYLQLAKLAKTVPAGTDLTGLSIKAAIKLLSPPKPPKPAAPKPPIVKVVTPAKPRAKTIHVDIIDTWISASPIDRAKAVDTIGLDAILAAIPEAWLPLLERRLAERRQLAPKPAVGHLLPADGSIPSFLVRPVVKVEPDDDEPPPRGGLHTPNYGARGEPYCGPTAASAITGLPISEVENAIRQASGKMYRTDGSLWPVIGIRNADLLAAMRLLGWSAVEHMPPDPDKRYLLYDFARDHGHDGPFIVEVRGHYVAIAGGEFCDTTTRLPKDLANGVLDRPGFNIKCKGRARVKRWWRFEQAAPSPAPAPSQPKPRARRTSQALQDEADQHREAAHRKIVESGDPAFH